MGQLLTPELESALPEALLSLMNELTTAMFCIKDDAGRYVAVNPTFVQRTNERSPRHVIGRTAAELFVPELAERYESQDAQVLATGTPLRHELELIRPPGGAARWYVTTKLPLRSDDGAVVGLVSMSHDVGADATDDPAMHSLARVVEHIYAHLAEQIRVTTLAQVAGCSVDALERRVRRVFHRTPGQLILTMRIDHARELLARRDAAAPALAEVATECGFYDQAAFSRTFARLTGQTPASYRRAARRRT